jgi:hypothetical protein
MGGMDWGVWLFRAMVVGFVAGFAVQMATRWRLIQAAPNNFTVDQIGVRVSRFVSEIIFQSRVISARKAAGIAHLAVFWGFVAFGGFTTVEALRGLGFVDLTHTSAFLTYKWLLVPFAAAVLVGITGLGIRRAFVRPAGLGPTLSKESLLISVMIAVLMLTFFASFAMNHPHIAQVFGLETVKAGGSEGQAAGRAIVMEFVAGQSLEAAIGTSGIPLADALPIARQIADALEAAHERGIIHRDLKPGNIMLTPDGQVKVLDFGLAKATVPSSSSGSVSESPTLTARATQMGMIIGTAAYMAPEQARGKSVDRRADVWAFGVVLYEMLTGQRAFAGPEITDVLAKVIERDADFDRLPAGTPAAIRTLLRRCLTKDPKQRLRDIGEARVTIDDVITGRAGDDAPKGAGVAASRTAPSWLPWALAGLLGALSLFLLARPPAVMSPAQSISAALNLPSDVEFFDRIEHCSEVVDSTAHVHIVAERDALATACRAVPAAVGAGVRTLISDRIRPQHVSHASESRRECRRQSAF